MPALVRDSSEQPVGSVFSTMRVADGWYALTVVKPPHQVTEDQFKSSEDYREAVRAAMGMSSGARFIPGEGTPVRVFICEVCGYTEMYSGGIVDPATWGEPAKTEVPRGKP